MKFKHSETKVSTSKKVFTSRNGLPSPRVLRDISILSQHIVKFEDFFNRVELFFVG